MSDTLTALDATFLELEQLDDGALMGIGGVMVFDPLPGGGVPSLDVVCERLYGRLAALPRYSQRLSSARVGGLAWPHWLQDERFDIHNHVRHAAIPAPGGDDELCEWTADFFSHRLDRARPLWEMVLLEGLDEGRWALVQKTHHCLVDGVGSVDVLELLLDSDPTADGRDGLRPPGAGRRPPRESPWPDPLVQAAGSGAQLASAAVRATLHPGDALRRSRALAELLVRDEIVRAPRTSLGVPIGQTRRFAIVRAPLEELKAIGRELGGSVNDVILSACTGGLRRLLLERGERLPRRGLRAMVPVNLRDASQRLGLGNRVSSLFVDLPVAEPVAVLRLVEISNATRRLKASDAAAAASTLIGLAAFAPPVVLHATLARTAFSTRLFNVTITNVPGPQAPLYAFGAQLRELHPIVPLASEHAVGIAIFSYNGVVDFGINADRESTRDIAVLAQGIADGIEELRE